MRLIISRSLIESETWPIFFHEAYFYYIELLFVVFSLVFEKLRLCVVNCMRFLTVFSTTLHKRMRELRFVRHKHYE